jgi:hypothetical protein
MPRYNVFLLFALIHVTNAYNMSSEPWAVRMTLCMDNVAYCRECSTHINVCDVENMLFSCDCSIQYLKTSPIQQTQCLHESEECDSDCTQDFTNQPMNVTQCSSQCSDIYLCGSVESTEDILHYVNITMLSEEIPDYSGSGESIVSVQRRSLVTSSTPNSVLKPSTITTTTTFTTLTPSSVLIPIGTSRNVTETTFSTSTKTFFPSTTSLFPSTTNGQGAMGGLPPTTIIISGGEPASFPSSSSAIRKEISSLWMNLLTLTLLGGTVL